MKKILSLLLILAVLLGLIGCQVSNGPEQSNITDIPTGSTLWETTVETQATRPEIAPEVTEPLETQPVLKPEPTKPTAPKPTQPEKTEPTEAPTQPEETRPQQTDPIETQPEPQPPLEPSETEPAPQKSYTHKDEVAQYIHEHGRLPDNFITKKEARALGWRGGSLEKYAPGKCIGGDRFYNREGLLPEGYTYYECDIDTLGSSSRGAKRIVFSSDGLIYYTSDHYRTFTLLYGET